MEQEYRHAIALMRYSAIAPLIPGLPEGYKNLSDYLELYNGQGIGHRLAGQPFTGFTAGYEHFAAHPGNGLIINSAYILHTYLGYDLAVKGVPVFNPGGFLN